MLRASAKLDLTNHKKLAASLRSGEGPVKETLATYERLYRSFVLRRFDRFSRGEGNWLPLSWRTMLRKRSTAILVDTRFMRLRLATGIRAVRRTKDSLVMGFTSLETHPTAGVPVAELATKHDRGINVPARPILVQPDEQTKRSMLDAATRAYAKEARGA
jgi:hypothetical protein